MNCYILYYNIIEVKNLFIFYLKLFKSKTFNLEKRENKSFKRENWFIYDDNVSNKSG